MTELLTRIKPKTSKNEMITDRKQRQLFEICTCKQTARPLNTQHFYNGHLRHYATFIYDCALKLFMGQFNVVCFDVCDSLWNNLSWNSIIQRKTAIYIDIHCDTRDMILKKRYCQTNLHNNKLGACYRWQNYRLLIQCLKLLNEWLFNSLSIKGNSLLGVLSKSCWATNRFLRRYCIGYIKRRSH